MRLSASKLKRYLQCPRSYFLRYVQHAPEDTGGKYLEVGNAFDLAVQHYCSGGRVGVQSIDPKIRAMLAAVVPSLPPPNKAAVQTNWCIVLPEHGLIIEAKPDLIVDGAHAVVIIDTKTTAASRASAMTREQLRQDVQALLYAWCAYFLGATSVTCRWVYTSKEAKPKSWTVAVDFTRAEVQAWFESVALPAARAMAALESEVDADRVQANLDSCERCWVRGSCTPFDGPNNYDGVDARINLVQLRKSRRPALPAQEGQSMVFDLKKLHEDVDLTEVLTASVIKAAAEFRAGDEAIAINPPAAETRPAPRPRKARPTPVETPAESTLENLASELQTVVDTCQGAIARIDRMLAAMRGGAK